MENIYMLCVDDSFSIYSDGCIITGILKGGRMSVGDQVWIIHADGSRKLVKVKKMVVLKMGKLIKRSRQNQIPESASGQRRL